MGAAGLGLAAAPLTFPTLRDQQQPRYDYAAPVPQGPTTLAQTFVAAHDGLTAIELLAVTYPDAPPDAALTLQLLDSADHVLAEQVVTQIAHNAPLRFNFSPLAHSAQQTYTLRLQGDAANQTTAWAYRLDGYAAGELWIADAPQGDLHFTTFYVDTWVSLGATIGAQWLEVLPVLPVLWLLGFVPGLLWLAWWPWPHLLTAGMRWGLALAFSLAFLPLLWLWVSVLGLQWRPLALCLVYVTLGAVYLLHLAQHWRKHGLPTLDWPSICLLGILLVSVSLRFAAARDLVLPAWVDGVHHYAITRVLEVAGRIPADYAPLYPIPRFVYHFGFHTLTASLHWLVQLSQPTQAATLAELMLWLGQILNGLQPLAAYTLTVSFTRRPWAGVVAAFILGLVTQFPPYHVTWGRYTHLAGMILLAAALAGVWVLLARPGRTHRPLAVFTAVVASGLLLTHYPVFILWVAFCAVVVFFHLRRFWRWLWVGLPAVVLAAPWLWHLANDFGPRVTGQPSALLQAPGENTFPFEYFGYAPGQGWVGQALDLWWMGFAACALIWAVVQLPRHKALSAVAVWLSGVALAVNVGDGLWLLNNRIFAISLFLPTAVGAGWLLTGMMRRAKRWWAAGFAAGMASAPAVSAAQTEPLSKSEPLSAPETAANPPSKEVSTPQSSGSLLTQLKLVLGVLVFVLCVSALSYSAARGALQQLNILNPVTILVTDTDLAALEWVAANTPPEAVFAINSWPWLGSIWAGGDGGTWVWPLTERRSILPPSDYVYMPLAERQALNELNQQVSSITDADAPETLALWRTAGITHIFIGHRGGALRPELFANSPNYELLYSNGGAWVFAVGGK